MKTSLRLTQRNWYSQTGRDGHAAADHRDAVGVVHGLCPLWD